MAVGRRDDGPQPDSRARPGPSLLVRCWVEEDGRVGAAIRGTVRNLASGALTPFANPDSIGQQIALELGIETLERLRAAGRPRGVKQADSAEPRAGRPGREGHRQ